MESPLDNDLSLTHSCVTIPNTCFFSHSFSSLPSSLTHPSFLFQAAATFLLISSVLSLPSSLTHRSFLFYAASIFSLISSVVVSVYQFQAPDLFSFGVYKKNKNKQLNISMEMHYLHYNLSLGAKVSFSLF